MKSVGEVAERLIESMAQRKHKNFRCTDHEWSLIKLAAERQRITPRTFVRRACLDRAYEVLAGGECDAPWRFRRLISLAESHREELRQGTDPPATGR